MTDKRVDVMMSETMNETKKEKQLRYTLLVIAISLTIGAFYMQTKTITGSRDVEVEISAVILHESNNREDNPLLALYNKQQKKHVVTIYEIERDNDYHFLSKETVELKQAPTELARDKSGHGVWMRQKDKWIYYNGQLEAEANDPLNKVEGQGQGISFATERVDINLYVTITEGIHRNRQLILTEKEEPISLYSLTSEGTVWLALFKEEVKIIAAKKQ